MENLDSREITYATFEYLYRDGGNFKSWGMLLLEGEATEEKKILLASCLDSGVWFSAEKLNIPVLYEGLMKFGPSTLDHGWHEFADLRPATNTEIESNTCFGDLDNFIHAFMHAKKTLDTYVP